MNWPRVKFESLYAESSRNGLYKSKEFHGEGTRIVNMGELFAYTFIGNQDMQLIRLTDDELSRFSLVSGDLLFARRSLIEEGAGKCVIVVDHDTPMVFESSIIRVRPNQDLCDSRFYYYYFLSPIGRSIIQSIITGVAQKGIRGSELKELIVHQPPIDTQHRIVSILSAYDDLIENNNRRIALLEESMQLLYREWFVRLRFPGHEHVRKNKNELPEGWSIKNIGSVIQRIPRYKKIKQSDYLPVGPIPVIDQGKEFISGFTDDEEAQISEPMPIIVFGDHTRRLKLISFPFASGADGTQLFTSNIPTCNIYYLYYSLLNIDLSNYAYARHFKFLKEKTILIPSMDIQLSFSEYATSIRKQIALIRELNRKLMQARDLLLPRLMSGEIDVS